MPSGLQYRISRMRRACLWDQSNGYWLRQQADTLCSIAVWLLSYLRLMMPFLLLHARGGH